MNFSVNYEEGPSGNVTNYYNQIFRNVGAKVKAGFPVSVVDTFGQFWATYLPAGGLYSNYSDLAQHKNAFSSGNAPMPILTLAEVIPGKSPTVGGLMYPGDNATNAFSLTSYEMTPFEFGSWAGGRVQAFMSTQYLGSDMSNGTAQNRSKCVQGFDKFTFVQGSTANAFTAWFIDDWYNIPIFAKRELQERQNSGEIVIPPDQYQNLEVVLVNLTATHFNRTFNQSLWATYPNPFKNYNEAMKNVDDLLIVDGSLSGETNPVRPLIVPARELDLVIIYETSTEAEFSWNNGTTLGNTARSAVEGNIPFPTIPDVNTMVTLNLTRKPTFFGCNATDTPLVLYLPNSPWSGYSNYSYTKPSFTKTQLDLILENAFNLATYGNGTVDAQWPECLACATIRGSARRIGYDLPEVCAQCFERHCWNGIVSTREITDSDLDLKPWLNSSLSYEEWNNTIWNKQDSSSNGGPSLYTSGAGRIAKHLMRHAAYPVVLALLHIWYAAL